MHIVDHATLVMILIKTFDFHSSAPNLLTDLLQRIQVHTGIRQSWNLQAT